MENTQEMHSELFTALRKNISLAVHGDMRRLKTLTWAVLGLCSSKSANISDWTEVVISRARYAASRERRFQRWLHNEHITPDTFYPPLLKAALADWDQDQRAYVALDTSVLSNGYVLIRTALIYRGRALPVAWRVIKHSSATVSYEDYSPVLEQTKKALPEKLEIVLLAEAEDKMSQGDYDGAIQDLGDIVTGNEDQAEDFFKKGNHFLMEQKFSKAIVAFKKAIKLNSLFIKAYTGIAEAYKLKGDMDSYKAFLQKAADEYARLDDFLEVRKIFSQILKCDANAPNPYNTLGINLRKEGKYPQALEAYKQALNLDPNDENIHYNVAKSYYFANEMERTRHSLEQALTINPDFQEARDFYRKVTGGDWDPDGRSMIQKQVL